jgi:hypothetical protein
LGTDTQRKELAQYLQGKEDKQKGLVELLKSAGVTAGLVDEEPKGNRFDLQEIDPFSFFCFIYKYGPDKRLQILQNIATELDLHYPEDELGVPSAQAQKVMMFPFKHHREEGEIKRLWEFFYSLLDGSFTNQMFQDTLNIYGAGIIKITEALFYVAAETYLPINGPTKPYLKVQSSDIPLFQVARFKVFEVERDDNIKLLPHCSSKHVSVLLIVRHKRNEVLIAAEMI